MTNKSAFHLMLASSTAMLLVPQTAFAQDNSAAEGEIIVSGQRQQYRGDVPLEEVPQSVQLISGETLAKLNITRLDSALELSSGIARQNNFGGLWDAFAVRGFSGDENFPSGFLVNGFNGGRGYGGPRDASNIERIEILKGPNGAVFGRGEPGGTVNIITKKATIDDTFGSLSASAGSFETYRFAGDVNLALSDTVAVRLNGAVQDAESFRDTIHSKKIVASPSILFKPTSKTSISYEMEFSDQEVPFDRGVLAVDGKLGVMDRDTFLGEPGDGPIKVKVLGHQLQLEQQLVRNWFLLLGAGYRDTSFTGFSSDPELVGGRQTLEETGNIVARQRRFRDYDTTNLDFRGEISGKIYTGPLTHHVLLGADWNRFKIDSLQLRFRPPPYTLGSPITAANNAINIFNPVYGQTPIPNATLTDTFEKQEAWGIYFQDQIDITERIKLRLGGRFDHFRQDFTNFRLAGNPVLVSVTERFSPTAGVLFELTDTLSIYGGYGTGFRPNSGADFAGDPFAPETSKSYEAGLRYTSLNNMISATLAAYHMKKTNVLTQDTANPNFSTTGGSARSRGVEADVTAKIPGDIDIIASYAYTDAVWSTTSADKDFGLNIEAGDPLINVPKHSANFLVTKVFALGDDAEFTLGAGVNYISKRNGETGTDFDLPGYTLVRALASYAPSEKVKISLDVTNLFNETYYPASYHRYWVTPGQPRTITARVDFSF